MFNSTRAACGTHTSPGSDSPTEVKVWMGAKGLGFGVWVLVFGIKGLGFVNWRQMMRRLAGCSVFALQWQL